MRVRNVHERTFAATSSEVGRLVDSLASDDDRLWPRDRWPAMRFDRPLAVGAVGGHGPIRYVVETYAPGESIRFRFTGPRGFDGFHAFQVDIVDGRAARLRHELVMTTHQLAIVSWPLVFRPLHDALIEDALDRAAESLGEAPRRATWSPWVRALRSALSRFSRRP